MEVTKLPVWSTVGEAYSLVWQNAAEYLKISWCWIVGAPVLFYLYSLIAGPYEAHLMTAVQAQLEQIRQHTLTRIDPVENASLQLKLALVGFPSQVIYILFGASIAVTWHRLILRNEKTPVPPFFRHDTLVVNYFLFGLLLAAASIAPQLLSSGISIVTASAFIGPLITLVPLIIICLFAVRFSMYLPALALGMHQISLHDVRARTKSNFWRLSFGYMLASLVTLVPLGIFSVVGLKYASPVLLSTLTAPLFIIFGLPFYLTFMSLAFRHFYAKELAN